MDDSINVNEEANKRNDTRDSRFEAQHLECKRGEQPNSAYLIANRDAKVQRPAPISLYIHWPFCKAKCPYCDFNSHVRERIDERAFVDALLRELDYMCELTGPRRLLSVFFGGGTPSLMSAEAVHRVLAHVNKRLSFDDSIEVTLEANPTSAEAEKFRGFRDAGINRVSLGVQSLRKESLAFLGREHSVVEALKAVELAASIFPRYSFDMIYALPGQSVADWQAELREALPYVGTHMSLYQLTIEERTAFWHAYHVDKNFAMPVEDLAADLYEATQEMMEARGLPAYEISNHARPGFESQHNLSYWLGREYMGIGPGAHGRLCIEEQWQATNTLKSPERWLEMVQTQGHGLEECVVLAPQQRLEEQIMMRLRLTDAIPRSLLKTKAQQQMLAVFARQGLIILAPGHFSLTRQGMLLQQYLVGELLC